MSECQVKSSSSTVERQEEEPGTLEKGYSIDQVMQVLGGLYPQKDPVSGETRSEL